MPPTAQSAFVKLLEPVQDRLYRYALAVMGDAEDAKDLVSDTILAAYEQFDRIRDTEKFLHFLVAIASRKSKRRIFRHRRFVRLDQALMETLETSHLSIEAAADLSLILDLLQHVPTRMRETFILFEVSDMTLNDIREIQGGSLSGVKSRLVRARERIARLLRIEENSRPAHARAPRPRSFEMTSTNLAFIDRHGE